MKKIICPQTGNPLNLFKGIVRVDAEFSEATKYFLYKNVKLEFIDGKLNLEKSFPLDSIQDYDVVEVFPKIKVKIESPFSLEWGDEIVLKENELYEELDGKLNSSLGSFDSDVIIEIVDFGETKNLDFYEIWLPTSDGKYRGYMEINFENIDSYEDLLNRVIELALENYEFYSSPEELLDEDGGLGYEYIPVIQKLEAHEVDSDYIVNELAYLLEKNSYDLIFERLEYYKSQNSDVINISEINTSIKNNPYFIDKDYKSLQEVLEKEFYLHTSLKDLGHAISNLYK